VFSVLHLNNSLEIFLIASVVNSNPFFYSCVSCIQSDLTSMLGSDIQSQSASGWTRDRETCDHATVAAGSCHALLGLPEFVGKLSDALAF
jgi:hypothetical protein